MINVEMSEADFEYMISNSTGLREDYAADRFEVQGGAEIYEVPTDGVARIVYWVEGCSYANVVLARAWLLQYTDDITVVFDLATDPAEDHDHGWAIITSYHTDGWRKALASCAGVQVDGQPLTDYLSHI